MYCSGYAYVGTSRGILPTMDMPLPELLMVDMLLPAMDMDMPLPGLLMVDMLSSIWTAPGMGQSMARSWTQAEISLSLLCLNTRGFC